MGGHLTIVNVAKIATTFVTTIVTAVAVVGNVAFRLLMMQNVAR
jgi:hypothetical protein